MTTPDQFQFYRTIKGAPALVLWIMLCERRSLTIKDLEHLTTYKRETLQEAVRTLGPDGIGIAAVSLHGHGLQTFVLADGWQMRLPGVDVEKIDICFPAITTDKLIESSVNKVVVVDIQMSKKSTSENPAFDECLKACKSCGIGEPSASVISDLRQGDEWMTPELIRAHCKALRRPKETIGIAILRLKGWEPVPAPAKKKEKQPLRGAAVDAMVDAFFNRERRGNQEDEETEDEE